MSAAARLARDVRNVTLAFRYRGDRYECPICEGRFSTFLPVPNGRDNATCPRCKSAERHRLLWLYLARETQILKDHARVLHIAPEPGTSRRLARWPSLDYVTTDIGGMTAMIRADLTALPFDADSFDTVICSHVLEHIPDDRAAMREIRRVVRPGGFALLQHPIDTSRAATFEDFSITDPIERERVFFQADHVRIYGRDIRDRLEACGFRVEVIDYNNSITEAERERFRTVQFSSARPERDLQADAIYRCA